MDIGLTACVFVGDQTDRFGDCLASVAPISDEIVLVVTSPDANVQTEAGEFGARVLYFEWNKNFAAMREFGRELAQNEWVLLIDADEVLQEADGLRAEVGGSTNDAYLLVRHNLLDPSRQTGITETEHFRLVRKNAAVRFEGRLDPRLQLQVGKCGCCDARLLHYGLISTRQLAKLDRNKELLELELAEHPTSLDARVDYGRALWQLGIAEGSRLLMDAAEAALSIAYMPSPPTKRMAVLFEFLMTLPESDLPYGWTLQTLSALIDKWAPSAPAVRWLQAQRAYHRGDWSSAKRYLELLIGYGRSGKFDRSVPFHHGLIRGDALFLAGDVNARLGLFREAEECFIALLGTEYELRARDQMKAIMGRRLELH